MIDRYGLPVDVEAIVENLNDALYEMKSDIEHRQAERDDYITSAKKRYGLSFDGEQFIHSVTVQFPVIELPVNHFWLIRKTPTYWSVEIVQDANEYNVVASCRHISWDVAVAKCLAQLAK